MKRLKLECTQAQFEGLHEALDGLRDSTRKVSVDKTALAALLRDHSRLLKEVPHD